MKKVMTAINHPVINQYFRNNCSDFIVEYDDIQYQEGLLEILRNSIPDALVLNEQLPGPFDRRTLIEEIRQIDKYFKIIIIVAKEDREFSKYLSSKGIFDILINDQAEISSLIEAINREDKVIVKVKKEIPVEVQEELKTLKKLVREKPKVVEKKIIFESALRVQRQEIITVASLPSVGKTDFITQLAVTFAKKSQAKILILDFDTENPAVEQFFGIERQDRAVVYEGNKTKTLNYKYIFDAIDNGTFNSSLLEEVVVKYSELDNLHIFSGIEITRSDRDSLKDNYFRIILEKAKSIYDFIFVDTNSNFNLAETKLAITSATKVFFMVEGTIINLNRSNKILQLFTNVWDIKREKLQIVVNKYSEYCLKEDSIMEFLYDFEFSGFFQMDVRHYFYLNKGLPMVLRPKQKELEKYLKILEKFNFIKKRSLIERLFKNEVSKVEEKEIIKFEQEQCKSEG